MFRYLLLPLFLFNCCNGSHPTTKASTSFDAPMMSIETTREGDFSCDTSYKMIHVFVALCDNKYQGIVPVPAAIGNGQDPKNNLYWGCAYGIKSFFLKSKNWKFVRHLNADTARLERVLFQHKKQKYFLIAEAYDGRKIKECTNDFLLSSAGVKKDTIHYQNKTMGVYGDAALLAYIGHDGLMDFGLNDTYVNLDQKQRDVIILACYSKSYFAPHLSKANVRPILWSTHLMSPEAYTLHDALEVYINKGTTNEVQNSAAASYAKYQKCSKQAANKLLVSGW